MTYQLYVAEDPSSEIYLYADESKISICKVIRKSDEQKLQSVGLLNLVKVGRMTGFSD